MILHRVLRTLIVATLIASCGPANETDDPEVPVVEVPPEPTFEFSPELILAEFDGSRPDSPAWFIDIFDRPHVLTIEIFPNNEGPSGPGIAEVSERDLDFDRCGLCIVLRLGCEVADGQLTCEQEFMPLEGTSLHLESLGTREGELVAGQISAATFEQVHIDPQTLATERSTDAQRLHLEDVGFQALVASDEQQPRPCGGNGQLHGDHCHCNPGFRVDPDNQLRCIPE